jgi:hypothetical protein
VEGGRRLRRDAPRARPGCRQVTNNLFAWIREEGECDERLAALDWGRVPELVANGQLGLDELERARTVVAEFLARRTKRELSRPRSSAS